MSQAITTQLSLVRGGPMHTLQGRLGLLSPDGLPNVRAGLAFAALAWMPLAILVLVAPATAGGMGFFADVSNYARYVIAIFALVVMDRTTEARVSRLLQGFIQSGIIGAGEQPRFMRALDAAARRTSSRVAEAVMLVAAYLPAILGVLVGYRAEPWAVAADGSLSIAGWYSVLVSGPVFFFFLLRWLWRFVTWADLLRSASRFRLDLVATHPDRAGGLGFLTIFPMIFVPLIFVLSIVVASQSLQDVLNAGISFEALRNRALFWTAIATVVVIGPLTTFSPKLLLLRERALIDYSEIVSRYSRMAERRFHGFDQEHQPLETDIISGLADIAVPVRTIETIKPVPVHLWAIIPLLIATFAPMLAVAGAMMPIQELAKRVLAAFL